MELAMFLKEGSGYLGETKMPDNQRSYWYRFTDDLFHTSNTCVMKYYLMFKQQ